MNKARQELYNRIRQTSREDFILDEMIRHGFWPAATEKPEGPVAEVQRMEELREEIRKLTVENRHLQNTESIRRQQRLERLKNCLLYTSPSPRDRG